MAILKMYSIHDQAAGAYLAPFFFENDLMAIRAFAALVNNPEHLFCTSPSDFCLFEFGSFDNIEGTIQTELVPRRVRGGPGLSRILKPVEESSPELYKEAL